MREKPQTPSSLKFKGNARDNRRNVRRNSEEGKNAKRNRKRGKSERYNASKKGEEGKESSRFPPFSVYSNILLDPVRSVHPETGIEIEGFGSMYTRNVAAQLGPGS